MLTAIAMVMMAWMGGYPLWTSILLTVIAGVSFLAHGAFYALLLAGFMGMNDADKE